MEMQRNKYKTLVITNGNRRKDQRREDHYIYLMSQMCNQLNMIAHYNRYLFTKCRGMKEKKTGLIFAFKV